MYNTDLPMAEFDEEGLSTKAGWAKVYRANGITGEYIGHADMDNVPYRASLAADAYLDSPDIPTERNVAIIRSKDGTSWVNVPDYRGVVVYNKETKQPVEVTSLGEIPDGFTIEKPKTEFDKWDGKKWSVDKEAKKENDMSVAKGMKSSLLADAEREISVLERKVRLGMASDEEKEMLNKMEIYSVKIADVDTSTAPNIDWPVKPE